MRLLCRGGFETRPQARRDIRGAPGTPACRHRGRAHNASKTRLNTTQLSLAQPRQGVRGNARSGWWRASLNRTAAGRSRLTSRVLHGPRIENAIGILPQPYHAILAGLTVKGLRSHVYEKLVQSDGTLNSGVRGKYAHAIASSDASVFRIAVSRLSISGGCGDHCQARETTGCKP